MADRDPGVPGVEITVAISRVRPFSTMDRRAIDGLIRRAASSRRLNVRVVIWKGNIGRDFSSARACLASIAEVAADHDFVMVRNRSAYGPLTDSWYHAYVRQYEKFPSTGLVGSTINFSGHPRRPTGGDSIHVQTYVYVSQWQHLKVLVPDYPGSQCDDRLELIVAGEIALSRRIMDRGLRLTCLHWPDHAFDSLTRPDPSLPRADIKRSVVRAPFRYKYRQYHQSPTAVLQQLVWFAGLRMPFRGSDPSSKTTPSLSRVSNVYTDQYG